MESPGVLPTEGPSNVVGRLAGPAETSAPLEGLRVALAETPATLEGPSVGSAATSSSVAFNRVGGADASSSVEGMPVAPSFRVDCLLSECLGSAKGPERQEGKSEIPTSSQSNGFMESAALG